MFKFAFLVSMITNSVFAQDVAGVPQASFMSFLPLIAIFFVFYFLMIRPQKKKMEEEQRYIAALKKGDEVVTRSGILGTIHGMTDSVVTLEVAENVKIKVLKSTIAGPQQTAQAVAGQAAPANNK